MYFNDRHDAAVKLARALEQYRNRNGVVLAIPRGGVPIGHYLAKQLGFAFDLLMTKKIGHPLHPEYAIGAAGLEDLIIEERESAPEEYLETEVTRIRSQLKERYRQFMGDRAPVPLGGKIVIVTDDGIATGRTILAALKMIRRNHPDKLIVAVPVSSLLAAERIAEEVDEFVCLYTPSPFDGVGRFYRDFSQVEDEEVAALLKDIPR